jgi:hypothetical protein
MVSKKSALGRGFDLLMPSDLDTSLIEKDNERVQKLYVSSIFPNPDQPRRFLDVLSL